MNRKKPRGLLLAGAAGLLIVVGLLAFGEQARHGPYHLDGGRGWDLPAPTSVDFAHIQFHPVVCPQIADLVHCAVQPVAERVLPTETPSLPVTTHTIGVKRRPPPEF